MARQYSPKKFLREAPNHLLRRYLEDRGLGGGLKWNSLRSADIDPIFRVIETAPASARAQIDSDFRDIEALADEGGVRTLIQEGRHPKHDLDLAPVFEKMGGHLDCALWTFLEHPEVFEVAQKFDYADGLTFEKRSCLPDPREKVTEESVPRLKAALSEYYCREEGRGQGCEVDHYLRDDRLYYFCFLEDYAQTKQVYDDEHVLRTEKQRPVFEIIFIYNPVERTLETKVQGGRGKRIEVERIFGRTVLGVDLGEPPESGVVYDLNGLLDREFEFVTKPSDRVESVSLRRLKLRIMGTEHRSITLEVGAKAPQKAVYDLLDDILAGKRLSKDLVDVAQAGIRIVFAPGKKGKRPSRSFKVTHPDSCDLRHDPKDDIARAYLKRWGIDISERNTVGAPEPGIPAQYRIWP